MNPHANYEEGPEISMRTKSKLNHKETSTRNFSYKLHYLYVNVSPFEKEQYMSQISRGYNLGGAGENILCLFCFSYRFSLLQLVHGTRHRHNTLTNGHSLNSCGKTLINHLFKPGQRLN